MNQRSATIVSSLSIACFLSAALASPSFGDERPNIVFLMADDQCCFSLGCYGNKDVKTPNIDQLAVEGLLFENHYVTTAICMASRANVMTGMYEHKTGCNFNHGPMIESVWRQSYPVLLRKAGYTTAFAGKFGFEVASKPGAKSHLPIEDFDTWHGGPGQTSYETKRNPSIAGYAKEFPHATLAYGAAGRDFIKTASQKDNPFCLSISFKAPHRPVTPDPKFDHVYAGKSFTKPKNFGRENSKHLSVQSRKGRQYNRFYSWGYADDYDRVMAKYHQQCYAIDVAVGMIREALEQAGVADNTVVIYTSDNGFFCGAHGYGSKVLPYEESTRVPLIVFDPRRENTQSQQDQTSQIERTDSLTGNIDFAPTMLELAGIEVPAELDGRSVLPIYKHPSTSIHDSLMLINAWGPAPTQCLSVVTKEWKYIYWFYKNGAEPTEELFNLQQDPLELHNSANDSAAKQDLKKMRKFYDSSVADWRAKAVKHNRYKSYSTLFDRNISWEDKSPLVKTIDQPKGN